MIEAEVVDFINEYTNEECKGAIESPPSKNRRSGILRVEKGVDFNEALKFFRDINSKSWRTKNSLAWDFYYPYEEDGKETDLKWYFCTFCYENKHTKTE